MDIDSRAHAKVRPVAIIAVAVWLGIVGGVVLLRPPILGRLDLLLPLAVIAAALAVPYGLGIVFGRQRGLSWLWLVVVAAAAVWLRATLADTHPASDVLPVTVAAIERLLAGASPYGVAYSVSDPPGAPFPFGPVALVWYAIAGTRPEVIEMVVAIAIAILLVIRARPVGAAVYAFSPLIATMAIDGSNDTSVGFLVLVGVIALAWRPAVGGAILGLAAAFKLFAAAWILPAAAAFGWSVLAGSATAFLGAWAPALIAWGIEPIFISFRQAVDIHPRPAYSLAALVELMTSTRPARMSMETLRGVGVAIVTIVATGLVWRRRIDVAAAGFAVLVAIVVLGYWGSSAYLVIGAPVLCWELDRWLGTDQWAPRWPIPSVDRLAVRLQRSGPGLPTNPPAFGQA